MTADQRYHLDTRIATGGMGEVWRATDTVLGREVALKVLKDEYADDATFRSRFETEARNAAALHHPNVASVFDFGELPADPASGAPPRSYLVMELVRGQPLSALLRGDEPMPAATATDLVAQAADGLSAAHDLGIVHRDVKPANLLVTPDGRVKITDFGIARAADAVALTQTGQVLGTPQYLSPEQAQGQPATAASDTYSLGVVLYECLAGRRPFDASSPVATALGHLREEPPPLPDDVPVPLRAVVATALAKDPADRFASTADLASALRGGPIRTGGGAAGSAPSGAQDPTVVAPAAVAAAAGAAGAAGLAGEGAAASADGDGGTRLLTPASGPPPEPGPGRPGGPRRRPAWLPWAAAAAAVVLVIAVIALLARDRTDEPSTTTNPPRSSSTGHAGASRTPSHSPSRSPSPSPSSSPSTDNRVEVNRDDYVGRPKDEAKHDLEALGLRVEEQTVDNTQGAPKDTVADVSPTGKVDPDQTITLSVYGEPVVTTPSVPGTSGPPATSGKKGPGKGKGKKSR